MNNITTILLGYNGVLYLAIAVIFHFLSRFKIKEIIANSDSLLALNRKRFLMQEHLMALEDSNSEYKKTLATNIDTIKKLRKITIGFLSIFAIIFVSTTNFSLIVYPTLVIILSILYIISGFITDKVGNVLWLTNSTVQKRTNRKKEEEIEEQYQTILANLLNLNADIKNTIAFSAQKLDENNKLSLQNLLSVVGMTERQYENIQYYVEQYKQKQNNEPTSTRTENTIINVAEYISVTNYILSLDTTTLIIQKDTTKSEKLDSKITLLFPIVLATKLNGIDTENQANRFIPQMYRHIGIYEKELFTVFTNYVYFRSLYEKDNNNIPMYLLEYKEEIEYQILNSLITAINLSHTKEYISNY